MQRVWFAIVLASLGWGTAGVATRSAFNEGVTPYRLAEYRSTFAVIAVLIFLVVLRRGFPRNRVAWMVGTVMGFTNLAVSFILGTLALQYAGAGFVGLTTALIPLVTAAIAHFTPLEERLTVAKMTGLLIAFGGVAVLLFSGDTGLAEGGRPVIAGLLSIGAVISISIGTLYAKFHAGEYDPLDVTGIHFASGTIIIAIAAFVVEGGPTAETGKAWLLMVYLALASTFLPMILYYWLLQRVTATYAALAGYVVPVIAIAAGVVFLDEELQSGIILGGVLILIGVLITDRAERRPKREASAVR